MQPTIWIHQASWSHTATASIGGTVERAEDHADRSGPPVPRGYAPPVERTEIEVVPGVLEAYVGTYRLDAETELVVTLEEGRLFVEPTGQGRYPLFAESEAGFCLPSANVQITFTKDATGAVDGLVLHQGGRDRPAERIRDGR